MPSFCVPRGSWLLLIAVCLILLPGKAEAFGAGNIPSISQVEGHNWRHGDIEDILETIAFLGGKKWSSMLIKRTYFGNWLRDYSQAVDVGTLKGVNSETIRILVWVLSFMAFGYATEEFEVTADRLGVYRAEEHIDNPLGYADGVDAQKLDKRLRGPVDPIEVEIDPKTGMKNYIANETGRWATSAGYLRFSFARSIHFGRLYTSGGHKGKDEDLCEALRCLGQALHCMEDFSAHSNYCELALRELGHSSVFPHCGTQTEIMLRGKRVYPLVTGTFGAVDFLHSVIGEATDHFTQSEVEQVDIALEKCETGTKSANTTTNRGFLGIGSSSSSASNDFISLLGKLPGIGDGFASQASSLKEASDAQERQNIRSVDRDFSRDGTRDNANVVPGMSPNFDPVKVSGQIYPILQFRDKIVKAISRGISKIPGLEKLLERISENLTAFILGLLAPFIRPIIKQVSNVLKDGSSGIISASSRSQLEPWDNPRCSDPTHSMLSKDHFTNVLNSCAGRIAATILQYVVPRILYAWENPGVPVDEVVNDVLRAFHHPAARDDRVDIQRQMFETVKSWANEHPRRHELSNLLSSQSVKNHKNHIIDQSNHRGMEGTRSGDGCGHSHGTFGAYTDGGHGKVAGSLWAHVANRDMDSMAGKDGDPAAGYLSTSPAPPSQSFDYGRNPSYESQGGYQQPPPGGYQQQPSPGGYQQPPPGGYQQPPPGGYQQPPPGGYQQPPPGGYQQQPSPGSYQQPPGGYYPPQQSYGAPPPGQWGAQPPAPPPGYGGGQGYGAPGQPPYEQPSYASQGPHQGQQPPSWNQYPGQGPRY